MKIAHAMPGNLATLSLTSILMERLAIRLSHHKTMAKSLVISRRGERSEGGEARQTNRYASFTLNLS